MAYAELYEMEDEDMLVVDAGRYGFVKLQCYTLSYGSEELDTYTDSHSLLEGLWDEWLNLDLFLIAMEMQLDDIVGSAVYQYGEDIVEISGQYWLYRAVLE